jgi:hypothetical protein
MEISRVVSVHVRQIANDQGHEVRHDRVSCKQGGGGVLASNTAANNTACIRVRVLAPTDVAKAFATSFAPMPYAITKATKAPAFN